MTARLTRPPAPIPFCERLARDQSFQRVARELAELPALGPGARVLALRRALAALEEAERSAKLARAILRGVQRGQLDPSRIREIV